MMPVRSLGKRSGLVVPPVNLGTARLPRDHDEAARLIRQAVDAGMTFIDSSRTYDNSELKVALALKNGYRDRVILSAKWSPWAVKVDASDQPSADCARRRIDEQLNRLQTDHIDVYLLWLLNTPEQFRQATARGGLLDGVLQARSEGIVGHIGFSSHDAVEHICAYLRQSDWCEMVMVSYNMMNHHHAAVLDEAHSLGIGTLVMNPMGGGKFVQKSRVLSSLARTTGIESIPDLAIRYVLSNPDADAMLSGIASHSDLENTLRAVQAGPLSEEQLHRIHLMLSDMDIQLQSFCTACGYCMPCPNGVDIPAVMACLERLRYWDLPESARKKYRMLRGRDAGACTRCGECMPRCTQHLPIPEEMHVAHRAFSGAVTEAETRELNAVRFSGNGFRPV